LGDEKSPEFEALADMFREAKAADLAAFPDYSISDLMQATHSALSVEGPDTAYEHTAANRARMREFGSKLITRYLEAFKLASDHDPDWAELEIDADARCEVEALKLLVRVFVIRRPGLAVVQHGQERVIRGLFSRYFEASQAGESGDRRLFPPGAKERLHHSDDSPVELARVVVDLIAGLTEAGAVKLHQRLSGGWSSARALDATAHFG
jgi:dGTPase